MHLGDLWTGQVTEPEDLPEGMQYYFSGHIIADTVLEVLVSNYSLNEVCHDMLYSFLISFAGYGHNCYWLIRWWSRIILPHRLHCQFISWSKCSWSAYGTQNKGTNAYL